MKNARLLTLILSLSPCLAACDTAIVAEKCGVTLVGAQPVSEDWDLDGAPDHAPWVAATLKGECSPLELSQLHVGAYGTSPALSFTSNAKLASVKAGTCAIWTWGGPLKLPADWAIVATPEGGGDVAAVYSATVDGFPGGGAALPVWNLGGGWSSFLPHGLPVDCDGP